MGMNSKKTEVVTFRTDKPTKEAIEKYAVIKKWSTSQAAEEIIRAYLGSKEAALSNMRVQNNEMKIPFLSQITKNEDETINSISQALKCSYDDALRFALHYVAAQWPVE